MMGQTAAALGEKIIEARVTYNDALATQGPKHPSTIEAWATLTRLMHAGRTLFAQ